jgi:hypothetical protein
VSETTTVNLPAVNPPDTILPLGYWVPGQDATFNRAADGFFSLNLFKGNSFQNPKTGSSPYYQLDATYAGYHRMQFIVPEYIGPAGGVASSAVSYYSNGTSRAYLRTGISLSLGGPYTNTLVSLNIFGPNLFNQQGWRYNVFAVSTLQTATDIVHPIRSLKYLAPQGFSWKVVQPTSRTTENNVHTVTYTFTDVAKDVQNTNDVHPPFFLCFRGGVKILDNNGTQLNPLQGPTTGTNTDYAMHCFLPTANTTTYDKNTGTVTFKYFGQIASHHFVGLLVCAKN